MLPLMITAIENDDDRQLAAELYTRYRAVMLRQAGSILKEDDRAEEAVQEAMLRVIRHLEKVRMIPENERAYYLAAVTQTAALDLYRRRQREQQNAFTGYDESLDASGPAEDGPMELLLLRREQAVLLRQHCKPKIPSSPCGSTFPTGNPTSSKTQTSRVRCASMSMVLMTRSSMPIADWNRWCGRLPSAT